MIIKHDVNNCIPKDKHDLVAVERARSIGFPEINLILSDLLIWVQDSNWPVAISIGSLLSGAGVEIVPALQRVFKTTDAIWKFNVLNFIVQNLDRNILSLLEADIAEIVSMTDIGDEDDQDLVALANEVLLKITN